MSRVAIFTVFIAGILENVFDVNLSVLVVIEFHVGILRGCDDEFSVHRNREQS